MRHFHINWAGIVVFTMLAISTCSAVQTAPNKIDRGPEPVVDMDKPQADSKSPDVRRKRSTKHNVPSGRVLHDPEPGEEEDGFISEGHQSLPALPVGKSDAIVIGTVKKASAFLSDDRHFVYSEFEINVGEVLKSTGTTVTRTGDEIDAERLGGAVRFPSGRIWKFRVFEQGFPQVGQTYVFFLREQPETKNFSLVTGYELRNGTVMPLDGVGYGSNPASTAFVKYKGTGQEVFFADLRQAILSGGM